MDLLKVWHLKLGWYNSIRSLKFEGLLCQKGDWVIFIFEQLSYDTLNVSVFNKHRAEGLWCKHYPIKIPVFYYIILIYCIILQWAFYFAYGFGIILAKVHFSPSKNGSNIILISYLKSYNLHPPLHNLLQKQHCLEIYIYTYLYLYLYW